jgi:hypothetical protein
VPALASACAAMAAIASCVTVPPADPPQVPAQGPVILQDSVTPPGNQYLTALPPQGFVVPVKTFDPNKAITCHVFIDFDPGSDNSQFASGTAATCPNTLPALDGGITNLTFTLTPTSIVDPTVCHQIQCFVADVFDPNSAHTAGDSLGAQSVTWQYSPNGAGNCQQFDGGDGAAPVDAPIDGLLLTPDVVGPPL